jgi:hypothetical protein
VADVVSLHQPPQRSVAIVTVAARHHRPALLAVRYSIKKKVVDEPKRQPAVMQNPVTGPNSPSFPGGTTAGACMQAVLNKCPWVNPSRVMKAMG